MRELNAGNLASARIDADSLEQARRHKTRHEDGSRKHGWRLRALEPVFGPAVRAAAEEHLEESTENAGEAFYHYERAIELLTVEASELRAEVVHLRSSLTNAGFDRDRARELPAIMVERAERYFKKTRRARPGWLKDAIAELARRAGDDEEPF